MAFMLSPQGWTTTIAAAGPLARLELTADRICCTCFNILQKGAFSANIHGD
jgi:hypothetical protein